MKRDHTLYLADIAQAFALIEQFIAGMDGDAFTRDEKTKSAVVRQLEVMGEAAKQVPDDIRQRYPGLPWKSMTGMRDRLIHGYFGIDYVLVWDTVAVKFPALKPVIMSLAKNDI